MKFLRWAGSKSQLVDTLANCWYAAKVAGGAKRYVEAFAGSAALYFSVLPRAAILVDLNEKLHECMAEVKARPKEVYRHLSKLPGDEDTYYRVRAANIIESNPTKRAAQFIYLNRYCFNGLYRTNLKGEFNVPFGGGTRNGKTPTLSELVAASVALQPAEIICGDFYDVLSPRIKPGDFVYLDPPYAKRNISLDNQYGPDVFGTQDLERLAKLTDTIHGRGAAFVISYADCDEINAMVHKWNSHKVSVKRSIAANAQLRGRVDEVLITNL